MDYKPKHTTAAEMEEFLSLTPAERELRIWLNGKETNGSVAEAFREIEVMGKELQRLWVHAGDNAAALEKHESVHLKPEEIEALRDAGVANAQVNTARLQMWDRVNTMWSWFVPLRWIVLVAAVPAVLWLSDFLRDHW